MEYKNDSKSQINVDIKNTDGITYLKSIENNSIDLILTDPPYIISKDTGMNTFYNNIKNNENIKKNMKTNEEWEEYKIKNKIINDEKKKIYI